MVDWPIFSLEEANARLPAVIAATDEAMAALKEIERVWGQTAFRAYDFHRGALREDLVCADWARAVAALGAQPKGYFVVDFQSPEPDVVFCWAHGETRVEHQHATWESFVDRRLIADD